MAELLNLTSTDVAALQIVAGMVSPFMALGLIYGALLAVLD